MILPLALPGLAAAAIFVFIISWNDVFAASVLTLRHRTLPAQVLTALERGAAPVPRRGRLLPARAVADRDLLHPQVPLQHVGEGGRGRWQASASSASRKTFGKVIADERREPDGRRRRVHRPARARRAAARRRCCAAWPASRRSTRGRDPDRRARRDRTSRRGRRRIAMVFQSYAVFPHMTVYDNIGFGLKMQKESKATIKERVAVGRRARCTSRTCSTATRRRSRAGSGSASRSRARSRRRRTCC